MDDWLAQGCNACRQGVLSAHWPPPERIGVINSLHVFVHRCSECKAYWLFGERETHVVPDNETSSMLTQMIPITDPTAPGDVTQCLCNTNDRRNVDVIHRMSIEGVDAGDISEERDWDTNSGWHNSRFTHLASGLQWVVYLADHAWPGEVRLLNDRRTPDG